MDNASDYESGDCRFDPCQSRCYIFDNFGYSLETNLGVVDFKSINIVNTNIIHLLVSKAIARHVSVQSLVFDFVF